MAREVEPAAAPQEQQAQQTETGVVKVTAEQLGLNVGEQYTGQLEFDLGNLTAWDPAPIEAAAYSGPQREETCMEVARAITQSLVNQLFALPSESVKGGRLAQLPAPTTRLPREKPLPKPKPLTKWQQFALKKGITKRKRGKLEFDETSQDWKRRYGYKKANDAADMPIIEAKPGDKPGEDPFSALEKGKKERVAKNKKAQLQNAKLMDKAGALPATLKLAAALPSGSGPSNSKAAGPRTLPKTKRKELKDEIKLASRVSGVSTASMGKFDKKLAGEKPGERVALGKRRQFLAVTDTATERTKTTSMVDKFLRERSDDILDVRKAINKHEDAMRHERRAAKEVLYAKAAKKKGAGKAGGKAAGAGDAPAGPGAGPVWFLSHRPSDGSTGTAGAQQWQAAAASMGAAQPRCSQA